MTREHIVDQTKVHIIQHSWQESQTLGGLPDMGLLLAYRLAHPRSNTHISPPACYRMFAQGVA